MMNEIPEIYPVLVVNLVPALPAAVYFTGAGFARFIILPVAVQSHV